MKQGKATPNPALRGRSSSPMVFQIIHKFRDICPYSHGTNVPILQMNVES
jgi:hypothetical protein